LALFAISVDAHVLRTLRSACVLRRRHNRKTSLIAVEDQSCRDFVRVDNEGHLHSMVGVNLFIPKGMTCYLPT
jgi:hypothetical protein